MAASAAKYHSANRALSVRFDAILHQLCETPPSRLAVAVSGGSDSLALLHLAARWAKLRQVEIHAITIDHALRIESADEARQVASWCAHLSIPHQTCRWTDSPSAGNIQAQARAARYRMLADVCSHLQADYCLVGHTQDDQAETVALREQRGAGVVGLAGMSARITRHETVFLRPLLTTTRADLRDLLVCLDQRWIDDPSNENTDFARIRIRRALAKDINERARLLQKAANASAQRRDLEHAFATFCDTNVRIDLAGFISTEVRVLTKLEASIRHYALCRLLAHLTIGKIPRFQQTTSAVDRLSTGQVATLAGCRLQVGANTLTIMPELSALPTAQQVSTSGCRRWDARWTVRWHSTEPDLILAPLGMVRPRNGKFACAIPLHARATLPALWRKKPDGLELAALPSHIFEAGENAPAATLEAIFQPVNPLVAEPFCCIDTVHLPG